MSTAIHVSAQGVDGGGCGQTTATACKTIQQGIDNCTAAGCAVLVRHGLYPTGATINLRDAVNVYGGCRFDGEADRKYRTTIQANPLPGTPAIGAHAVNSPTTVHGLVVIGKDETANGSASIAMAVSDSKALVLTGSVLAAGRGGDGAHGASLNGAAGGAGGSPTCPTCRGAPGGACPSNPPRSNEGEGGAGAAQNNLYSHVCTGNCYCDSLSGGDRFGITGQNSGSAKGGGGGGPGAIGCSCWERFSQSPTPIQEAGLWNPGVGSTGTPGETGQCSTQGGLASGLIWGSTSAQGTAWLPSSGGGGLTASVGAGGGGGGSGGYATANGYDFPGLSGGGGGGGGCGGAGGQGGQQGGASLALVLANSTIAGVADQNSVVPGPGGRGGAGGSGGVGGPGGGAGPGYKGDQFGFDVGGTCHATAAPGAGGPGGPGGQGGAGSGGAGGDGGPSIGIALRGNSPAPANSGGIYLGTPGSGGAVGAAGVNPNCSGVAGASGVIGGSARFVDLDKPDSLTQR